MPTTTTYTPGLILALGCKPISIPVTIAQDAGAGAALAKGTLLGRVTASGKYAVYDNGNSDGTEVCSGILDREVDHREGDVVAGMYIPKGGGFFIESNLTGVDSAAKTDLGSVSIPGRDILAM